MIGQVVGEASADEALKRIETLGDQPLALVLADQWLREPHLTGESVLVRTRELQPGAKRALLVDWGRTLGGAPGEVDHSRVEASFNPQLREALVEFAAGLTRPSSQL